MRSRGGGGPGVRDGQDGFAFEVLGSRPLVGKLSGERDPRTGLLKVTSGENGGTSLPSPTSQNGNGRRDPIFKLDMESSEPSISGRPTVYMEPIYKSNGVRGSSGSPRAMGGANSPRAAAGPGSSGSSRPVAGRGSSSSNGSSSLFMGSSMIGDSSASGGAYGARGVWPATSQMFQVQASPRPTKPAPVAGDAAATPQRPASAPQPSTAPLTPTLGGANRSGSLGVGLGAGPGRPMTTPGCPGAGGKRQQPSGRSSPYVRSLSVNSGVAVLAAGPKGFHFLGDGTGAAGGGPTPPAAAATPSPRRSQSAGRAQVQPPPVRRASAAATGGAAAGSAGAGRVLGTAATVLTADPPMRPGLVRSLSVPVPPPPMQPPPLASVSSTGSIGFTPQPPACSPSSAAPSHRPTTPSSSPSFISPSPSPPSPIDSPLASPVVRASPLASPVVRAVITKATPVPPLNANPASAASDVADAGGRAAHRLSTRTSAEIVPEPAAAATGTKAAAVVSPFLASPTGPDTGSGKAAGSGPGVQPQPAPASKAAAAAAGKGRGKGSSSAKDKGASGSGNKHKGAATASSKNSAAAAVVAAAASATPAPAVAAATASATQQQHQQQQPVPATLAAATAPSPAGPATPVLVEKLAFMDGFPVLHISTLSTSPHSSGPSPSSSSSALAPAGAPPQTHSSSPPPPLQLPEPHSPPRASVGVSPSSSSHGAGGPVSPGMRSPQAFSRLTVDIPPNRGGLEVYRSLEFPSGATAPLHQQRQWQRRQQASPQASQQHQQQPYQLFPVGGRAVQLKDAPALPAHLPDASTQPMHDLLAEGNDTAAAMGLDDDWMCELLCACAVHTPPTS